ncbi:MAG: hypothetical protein ACRD6R_01380 [Candidatus Polarisedimenticolia bacterium]
MAGHHGPVVLWALLLLFPVPVAVHARPKARATVAGIVAQIVRADYEGDRAALKRLHGVLASLELTGAEENFASRVHYWRGFALWRRTLNGFNESADRRELGRDLEQALLDFETSARRDPGFVDARIGTIGCLQSLTFLNLDDPARVQDLVSRFVELFKETRREAPENPRLLWLLGASEWYNPPEHGGGRERALETYARGVRLARQQKGTVKDPLEPSWGEAELLMSLAWSRLNQTPPDLSAAEEHAKDALALVPYWHYVRDLLMPQIQKARIAP